MKRISSVAINLISTSSMTVAVNLLFVNATLPEFVEGFSQCNVV